MSPDLIELRNRYSEGPEERPAGMNVKPGWRGRLYEDFEVGDVYEHPLGRTVLAADDSWFTLLTMNTVPLANG